MANREELLFIVKKVLDAGEFSFKETDDGNIELQFPASNKLMAGGWEFQPTIWYGTNEEGGMLTFTGAIMNVAPLELVAAPQERRGEFAEYIARANYASGQSFGAFLSLHVDDDGFITCQTAIDFSKVKINGTVEAFVVRDIITKTTLNMQNMMKIWLPGLTYIVEENLSPLEAVERRRDDIRNNRI